MKQDKGGEMKYQIKFHKCHNKKGILIDHTCVIADGVEFSEEGGRYEINFLDYDYLLISPMIKERCSTCGRDLNLCPECGR